MPRADEPPPDMELPPPKEFELPPPRKLEPQPPKEKKPEEEGPQLPDATSQKADPDRPLKGAVQLLHPVVMEEPYYPF